MSAARVGAPDMTAHWPSAGVTSANKPSSVVPSGIAGHACHQGLTLVHFSAQRKHFL
jgi:hypothetical protein